MAAVFEEQSPAYVSRLARRHRYPWCFTTATTISDHLGISMEVYPHSWMACKWNIPSSNLVGGLEHQFYFPIYWVANHPN